jgi:hypothetical protein
MTERCLWCGKPAIGSFCSPRCESESCQNAEKIVRFLQAEYPGDWNRQEKELDALFAKARRVELDELIAKARRAEFKLIRGGLYEPKPATLKGEF